ncbi:hypothetical protein S2091_3257 [Solimicrobium silvestre]|uniref:Uncharacterized protein n=2 Tax=Solimicrobium silvestre TaxID=2099400 RepID=A0A2S9GWM4_9BURK|nr:hypothetical protein S2091_3257 [Solimicrobium silvestre]
MTLIAAPLLAHAQVSINIGQPGFYGQIEIGNAPPPQVVYSAPVIVQAAPTQEAYPPMYLRVPEEHHRDWRRYCHEYNACNRQVYFVTNDWYNNSYAPHYAREHGHGHDHEYEERERERDRDHERDHGHDRDHEHERDHERDNERN